VSSTGSLYEHQAHVTPQRMAEGVTAELSLRITGGPDAASAARRALSGLERHLQSRLLDDIRLLVSELVTNSIRHAGVGPRESVKLEIRVATDKVHAAVCDFGDGFRAGVRRAGPGRGDGGGWGLFMVDAVADRWGIDEDDGTRVWFEIDRRRPRFAQTG
jgi:anti-sigma regulatory factor (Ser/Thr protein kinase)